MSLHPAQAGWVPFITPSEAGSRPDMLTSVTSIANTVLDEEALRMATLHPFPSHLTAKPPVEVRR